MDGTYKPDKKQRAQKNAAARGEMPWDTERSSHVAAAYQPSGVVDPCLHAGVAESLEGPPTAGKRSQRICRSPLGAGTVLPGARSVLYALRGRL